MNRVSLFVSSVAVVYLCLVRCHGAEEVAKQSDRDLVPQAVEYGRRRAMAEMYRLSPGPDVPIRSFSNPSEQSLRIGYYGLANSFALEWLNEKTQQPHNTTGNLGRCVVPQGKCNHSSTICDPVEQQATVDCEKAGPYRQEDGSCHDLAKPNYGMAGTATQRFVPNRYADEKTKGCKIDGYDCSTGCDSPRKYSVIADSKCLELPTARDVSISLSQSVHATDKHVSALFTTFGQFVHHDLTFSPVFHVKHSGQKKSVQPSCCPTKTSNQCYPIPVSEDDAFYSQYDITCLEFVRSLATTTDKSCGLGLRMQINQNTHWLDGSTIYGSGKFSPVPVLRENIFGFMMVSDTAANRPAFNSSRKYRNTASYSFVPLSNVDLCTQKTSVTVDAPCSDTECCVMAGDIRAGEQPPLTSLHTMWLRHHNAIALKIYDVNSNLDDEEIYQLARRIVLAQYQFVVYNELLPEIIGQELMKLYELTPLTGARYLPKAKYVPGQGKIYLEFSTAAGRFGHSLVPDNVFRTTDAGTTQFKLSDHLNRISLMLTSDTGVGEILTGSSQHPALQMDRHVTSELQNKLFKHANPYGGDLFASNIQRGRDHGIGTYYDVRQYCLGEVSVDPSWDSPVWTNVFQKDALAALRKVYRSPEDVDLFAGGIAEALQVEGQGVVGPTFACIIAKQFQQLKFGDRYWFEFQDTMINGYSQFTPYQLGQIRKTTLARLMCDETHVTSVMKRVLQLSSKTVQCTDATFLKETDVNYAAFIPKPSR